LSDATGGLARHTLTAVLTQFAELRPELRCHPFCDTEAKLRKCLDGIRRGRSLVFSTLASTSLKRIVEEICRTHQVPYYDLTGGCVEFIERHTGLQASNDVAAVHKPDNAYFDRIEALEFSLQHDDSRRLESIHDAEIVLLGISRVSKTPTSAYLGWLGHRVANVSIVPSHGLPEEIRQCRERTVGLTTRPKILAEVRNRRLTLNGFQEGLPESGGYSDLRSVIREVMEAEHIYRQLDIPLVDTSELTIEETAARVLEALGRG
jgi:regulator of PEP synthase PpsR (kinase-PPPase family)